jgi:hypothetical protein
VEVAVPEERRVFVSPLSVDECVAALESRPEFGVGGRRRVEAAASVWGLDTTGFTAGFFTYGVVFASAVEGRFVALTDRLTAIVVQPARDRRARLLGDWVIAGFPILFFAPLVGRADFWHWSIRLVAAVAFAAIALAVGYAIQRRAAVRVGREDRIGRLLGRSVGAIEPTSLKPDVRSAIARAIAMPRRPIRQRRAPGWQDRLGFAVGGAFLTGMLVLMVLEGEEDLGRVGQLFGIVFLMLMGAAGAVSAYNRLTALDEDRHRQLDSIVSRLMGGAAAAILLA